MGNSEEEQRMKEQYEKHKEVYKKRGFINEPVHGQMFNNLGIEKLHCIRDDCLDGEFELIALIHTLKKIEKKHGSFFPVPIRIGVYYFLYLSIISKIRSIKL